MAGGAATPNSWPTPDNPHLDPAASISRLRQVISSLDRLLQLPNSARSFAIYLGGLLLITAGAMLHILLAAQIMQDEVTLSRLKAEHTAIQQQNGHLLFLIARESNMMRLHEEVVAAGYVPAEDREYVLQPQAAVAAAMEPTAHPPADAGATSRPQTRPLGAGATHTGDPLRDWEALLGINLPFTGPPSGASAGDTSSAEAASGRLPGQSRSNTSAPESRSGPSEDSSGQVPWDQAPMETWQNWLGESKAFFNRLAP